MTLNEKLNAIRDGIEYLIDSQYVTYEIDDDDNDIAFYESDKYKEHWFLNIVATDDIMWSIVYLSCYFKFGTYSGDDE